MLSPLELLATSGLAWGLPFLLGVTTTFGGLDLATRAFDIAPAETRRLGFPWIATVMGAAVVVFGTLLIGTRISGTEPALAGSDT